MKKLILSVVAMASLALAANAVTYMREETSDGQIVKYDEEKVVKVDYEEESTSNQGVTVSGTVGGYTYVDLGLSVKWATYNVGASKPTEYGDYFAWGETKPKKNYEWRNYKWCKGRYVKLTKYNTDSDQGTVDNKTVLVSENDAATANWGSAWRMPTRAEQDELRKGCTWEWVSDFKGSGAHGQLGTSKANGNTIFLPAVGGNSGKYLYYCGRIGYYWSSSLSELYSGNAYSLCFYDGCIDWFYNYRYDGYSVRAVTR